MKKIFVIIAAILLVQNASATPEKVLHAFNQSFPTAESVVWSDEGDSYKVYFKRGAEQFRLWYDRDGVVQQSIRYYDAELLSPIIRSRVENKYKGKQIFGVTEKVNDSGMVYHIALQDEKKWYQITVDAAGNCQLVQVLNKK